MSAYYKTRIAAAELCETFRTNQWSLFVSLTDRVAYFILAPFCEREFHIKMMYSWTLAAGDV